MGPKRALILGVAGQDGAYLSDLLLSRKYQVHGTSRAPARADMRGLRLLGAADRIHLHALDIEDAAATRALIEQIVPDEIYCLAGQSSVGLSFDEPRQTIESIVTGTLNVLEGVRLSGVASRIFVAASTDCFGECERAATEETGFSPLSPYATAKASACWIARTYRKSFGIFASVGLLGNHESPLRPGRFVTRKIVGAVKDILAGGHDGLELGDVEIQREWGWAPEYVDAFWRVLQADEPSDFILSTGEPRSLMAFTQAVFDAAELRWQDHVSFSSGLHRPADIRVTRTDPAKAARVLGWKAQFVMADVASNLLACEQTGAAGWLPWREPRPVPV